VEEGQRRLPGRALSSSTGDKWRGSFRVPSQEVSTPTTTGNAVQGEAPPDQAAKRTKKAHKKKKPKPPNGQHNGPAIRAGTVHLRHRAAIGVSPLPAVDEEMKRGLGGKARRDGPSSGESDCSGWRFRLYLKLEKSRVSRSFLPASKSRLRMKFRRLHLWMLPTAVGDLFGFDGGGPCVQAWRMLRSFRRRGGVLQKTLRSSATREAA